MLVSLALNNIVFIITTSHQEVRLNESVLGMTSLCTTLGWKELAKSSTSFVKFPSGLERNMKLRLVRFIFILMIQLVIVEHHNMTIAKCFAVLFIRTFQNSEFFNRSGAMQLMLIHSTHDHMFKTLID
jgi:hypothetical protein